MLYALNLYKLGYSNLESRMDHGSSLITVADISICQDPVRMSGMCCGPARWTHDDQNTHRTEKHCKTLWILVTEVDGPIKRNTDDQTSDTPLMGHGMSIIRLDQDIVH